MKILFAGGNGYLPEFNGGVQSSTDHLVRQCIARGHETAVLAALFGDGLRGFKARLKLKLGRAPVAIDRDLGYPVMRAWFPWEVAGYVAKTFHPDVALVQCHKAVKVGAALDAAGVPLVVYLRNVEFEELAGDPRDLTTAKFIANSEFTAEAYKKAFGIDSVVIPPTIDKAKYTYTKTDEFVSFINLYPEKGFETALAVARICPKISFLFVESWKLDGDLLNQIENSLAALPNVTFMRRTNNMREVFGRTKILFAPSQWEEAWGRVASEAHCSGIPVVGSNRGGLPEAIGPGGIILPHDAPPEEWAAAIRSLWTDSTVYASFSRAAVEYAGRAQLDSAAQFETFIGVLEGAK
ncbi:glycosyltransferase [Sphingomonas qomolangmaensis]|uniref:Glycosyltransferase n=1 Tax=Sphingomonas qomolangmaensis TaxID=2918765 RepID=A0ABY5LCI4_9SPHN|nr:glycosyltransferase [Sphingomonas qomolangmaensis]UUL82411.1 glycosyltransferase [Sphingomonas qomolangmaensis]